MRLLVCGGRDFNDRAAIGAALDAVHRRKGIELVIQGGAQGADRWAAEWARATGVPVETFEADWAAHDKAAGPIRNRRMLVEGKPDGVLAFPGNRGTADMVKQADRAGVPVWQPYGDSQCR